MKVDIKYLKLKQIVIIIIQKLHNMYVTIDSFLSSIFFKYIESSFACLFIAISMNNLEVDGET
jgi:hypothetical protein